MLSQTTHLDTGTVSSTLKVWGQDATWLMNTTENVKEWADVTDGAVANTHLRQPTASPPTPPISTTTHPRTPRTATP